MSAPVDAVVTFVVVAFGVPLALISAWNLFRGLLS